jgi:hypothetical protein
VLHGVGDAVRLRQDLGEIEMRLVRSRAHLYFRFIRVGGGRHVTPGLVQHAQVVVRHRKVRLQPHRLAQMFFCFVVLSQLNLTLSEPHEERRAIDVHRERRGQRLFRPGKVAARRPHLGELPMCLRGTRIHLQHPRETGFRGCGVPGCLVGERQRERRILVSVVQCQRLLVGADRCLMAPRLRVQVAEHDVRLHHVLVLGQDALHLRNRLVDASLY